MNQGIVTHLPIGTELEHYTITDLLGKGGFGVTYLAEDTRLKQKVAIKEYFPSEMGVRANDSITLNPQSERVNDYQYGLQRFLDEARTLAQFKHPNIVRVSNFLEMNGTAYMVMDYEEGEDLSDYLKRTGFKGGMPETELKGYLVPILKGLQAVHEKGLLHRDVKPGNIYLRKNAEPMLIDFGAARYALGEQSKSMSAIISMGYAPPEQYSSKAKQSPASDLYAWGATAYELIVGKPPVESPDRSNAIFEEEPDPLKPLSQTHQGKYSDKLLSVIDQCLNIPQKKRPQSATEVLAMLTGEKTSTGTVKVNPKDRFKNKDSVVPEQSGTLSNSRHSDRVQNNNRHSEGAQRLRESHHAGIQPKGKSNIPKYAATFILLAGTTTASYYGYNYYTEQQQIAETQRIAAEAEQQKQKQAKEKALQEEQQAWQTAQQINTITSYQAYLDKYPEGINNTTATRQLTKLKEELGNLTTKAQKLLVKLGYQVPSNGTFDARTEAAIKDFETKQNILVTGKADQVLINSLQSAYNKKDTASWNAAQGDISKLQSYANNYPGGQFIDQVDNKIVSILQAQQAAETEKQRLAKIAADERDTTAWSEAQGDIDKLHNYAKNFPKGLYINEVENKILNIREFKKKAEDEKLAWSAVVDKNNITAYEEFITSYPNSQFKNEAVNKVSLLKNEIEKDAWDEALYINSPDSYSKFIKLYPDSRFTVLAKQKISDYKKSDIGFHVDVTSSIISNNEGFDFTLTVTYIDEENIKGAGLQTGDIILKQGKYEFHSLNEFKSRILSNKKSNKPSVLLILRKQEKLFLVLNYK